MKRLLLVFTLVLSFSTLGSSQFTIGGGASYVFPGSDFGFQTKALLGLSEEIDLSPSVGIFLGEGTPFVVDVDVHYALLEIGDDFRFMPFAGLNYINTSGNSDLGLNIGGSLRMDINENTLYLEPKLTLLTYAGMALSAGMFF